VCVYLCIQMCPFSCRYPTVLKSANQAYGEFWLQSKLLMNSCELHGKNHCRIVRFRWCHYYKLFMYVNCLYDQILVTFITIILHSGLDNKCTIYPLSFEETDISSKKKAVATHTSYLSCCSFTSSDHQVYLVS